ncbi:uncharacterized protein LOC107359325 [Tetranychus urticae]|uniref:NR LBD domain-containing protein n=1 Tax=Tetranychus urticae TaxID=32264 RepID=T1JZ67_TETUR|nr:uncharacterized protein LOC107359325 [Tetranychus urticae]
MMDFDQIFSFLQPLDSPTLDTDYALQGDTSADQSLPKNSCSNQSLSLLRAFCSDENTVKSYLLDGDELNNQNNGVTQFSDSSMNSHDDCLENCLSSGEQTNQSHGPLTVENLIPVQYDVSSCITANPRVMEYFRSKINDENFNLKSNFILLVKRGYKMILSENTDNSEVDEPWNPDVSQKILSVYFSSLSMKSEYLSSETALNGFESMLTREACVAFRGQKQLHLLPDLNDRSRARASPDWLISICNGIKGYRKIEPSDKVTLLCSVYNHLNLMEAVSSYDASIDGWGFSEYKYDRRDTFLFSQLLHDGLVHVIETFPERLRNDINAIILMYLIIIFNADVSGLKHPEIIRNEQFSYIYLLRRYLRTVCESDSEASDNHYRLMVKIEQLRLLGEQTEKFFITLLKEPFVETITKAVMGKYTHQFLQLQ